MARRARKNGPVGWFLIIVGVALGAYGVIGLSGGIVSYWLSSSPVQKSAIWLVLVLAVYILEGALLAVSAMALEAYRQRQSRPDSGPLGVRRAVATSKWLIYALAGVMLLGWIFAETIGRDFETDVRQTLARRSASAAAAISPERVAALSGSRADLSTPNYLELCNRLTSVLRANRDCQFVYLMGMREGKVIFIADSETVNSKDVSFPGDNYPEASDELKEAFRTGVPFVEGPVADRWGTWYSGIAPIMDPATGRASPLFSAWISTRGLGITRSRWSGWR